MVRLVNYFSILKSLRTMKKQNYKGYSRKKSGKSAKKIQSSNAKPFKVLQSPTKSFSDEKEYKVIQLVNGLTACLISDPTDETESDSSDGSDSETEETTVGSVEHEDDNVTTSDTDTETSSKTCVKGTKLAAAALCIGVGSVSDPKEIPGLAHFLEHMVFMGSEKFPQENDFDSFITKHGGSDNGSTDYEVTTFYFECFEKHLYAGLDKFSQFFISPLLNRDSMTREREAVESEFQLAVPSDDFRKEQLLVSLSRDCSPINSFSWGNLITLKDNITDDRLYEMLHNFRKRHYSAHRMTVAIQGRLPISTLESYILKCFSKVPSNGLPPDDFSTCENIYDTPKFRKLYYVKPIKDICQVDLTFCLPSLLRLYRIKPHYYISWVLGYQGKNGLYTYLKKKVWALSLTAGNEESGAEYNSIYATFTISLVLTHEGINNLKEVIESVFSYIDLLKQEGPSERIFKEIQLIGETAFRFEEEETAADNVEDLVENMQYFPPKDYLTGDTLMFEYDPNVISMIINNLVPTNMNVMVSSTEIPAGMEYNEVEPWFNTQYKAIDFPSDWLECWTNAKALPEFSLPPPNPFLTNDFSILPKDKKVSKYPEKIMDTPVMELWYRKDDKFELPVAHYNYYLISPLALRSAKSSCMMEMYAIFVTMSLAEEGYDAQLAELEYEITPSEKGISVTISGYNQNLHLVIALIGRYLSNATQLFSEQLFEAVKEKVTKSYYNGFLKPSRFCKDIRLTILQKNFYSLLEKHRMVPKVTYEEMREFSDQFLKSIYIQGLVQGNVTSATAISATNALLRDINPSPLAESDRPTIIMNEIPTGEIYCRVASFNRESSNSIVTNYYQCGLSDIKNTVILELILLLIEEPLFDTLRTKEQLGYKVGCSIRDTHGVLGYTVTVNTQIDKYSTSYAESRIEYFLEQSRDIVNNLSDKKFQHVKRDLIKMKKCVDVDLEDETARNWEEIVNCKYKFNRLLLEIKAIEGLKIQEVKRFWERHNVGSKNSTHRKLSLQIVGNKVNRTERKDEDTELASCAKEVRVRHSLTHKSQISGKHHLHKINENFNYTPTTDDFVMQYLQNTDEVTNETSNSYFIDNIESFKNSLKPMQMINTEN